MYQQFARVYDVFMKPTAPYEKWAHYIDDVFRRNGVPAGALVLDLACGTGSLAFLMAQKGYDMIGADASADMLSEATGKMYEDGLPRVLFLNQDMRTLELFGTVDAAYSTCDALNYILTEDDFVKTLKNVALYLNPGGVFVFDLKMEHKYRQLAGNTYHDTVGDASYVWKNNFDPATCINEYRVQFIFRGEGSYPETHRQRAYSTAQVEKMAALAGLKMLGVFDNYSNLPARADSERVTFASTRI